MPSRGQFQEKRSTRAVVVAPEGLVFGDVWVEVEQGVLAHAGLVPLAEMTEAVRQTLLLKVLLGEGLHRDDVGTCRGRHIQLVNHSDTII